MNHMSHKLESQDFQEMNGGVSCHMRTWHRHHHQRVKRAVSVIMADQVPELEELNTGTREQCGKPSLTESKIDSSTMLLNFLPLTLVTQDNKQIFK